MNKKIVTGLIVFFTAIMMLACSNAVSENQPVVSENQPTASENQSTAFENQPVVSENQPAASENQPAEKTTLESILEVHFIDVGQGDCTLLLCDGKSMLIDAGDNSKGTTVQLYLKKHGIEKLDYVIGTHPDTDHIGGLDVILTKYDCETVIVSPKENDTDAYHEMMDAISYRNIKITSADPGKIFELGGASFEIIGPITNYEDDNNSSIVVRVDHGINSFLFMGDAQQEAENDYIDSDLNLNASVLKVAHHGSKTSSSKQFLERVQPKYAVISCGIDNSYGHPHAETLNNLRQMGCQVYRTDEQGCIIATSDKETIHWNTSPSESWKAGEGNQKSDEMVQNYVNNENEEKANVTQNENKSEVNITPKDKQEDVCYILNTNTKKFHKPSCKSVQDMKEKNKQESFEDRDSIINEGYAPCKRCNP